MKSELKNMERIKQLEMVAVDERSLKKEMAKKAEKKKKHCRVRIIDEASIFSFKNQTKGLRWWYIPRDHLLLFPISFPGSESMRSSGNAILLVRYDPEMTP